MLDAGKVKAMEWKPFESKRRKSKDPAVSISEAGNIVMNSACIRTHFPTDPKPKYPYAKLYSNEEAGGVGIKPMQKDDGNCYSINYGPRNNFGSFSGTAFCKSIGYDFKKEKTRSFPAKWNDEEGLLEFSVKGK